MRSVRHARDPQVGVPLSVDSLPMAQRAGRIAREEGGWTLEPLQPGAEGLGGRVGAVGHDGRGLRPDARRIQHGGCLQSSRSRREPEPGGG